MESPFPPARPQRGRPRRDPSVIGSCANRNRKGGISSRSFGGKRRAWTRKDPWQGGRGRRKRQDRDPAGPVERLPPTGPAAARGAPEARSRPFSVPRSNRPASRGPIRSSPSPERRRPRERADRTKGALVHVGRFLTNSPVPLLSRCCRPGVALLSAAASPRQAAETLPSTSVRRFERQREPGSASVEDLREVFPDRVRAGGCFHRDAGAFATASRRSGSNGRAISRSLRRMRTPRGRPLRRRRCSRS